jgi:glycosyltransferase involved in cell wall biosynthesis
MRRVLLTAHKFFPQHRAGTEVLTLKIAQELQARGNVVKVVAANPPDLDARRKFAEEPKTSDYSSDYVHDGIDVHITEEPLRLKDFQFSFEYYHPHMKDHFKGLLAEFKPDLVLIVHAQNLSASIIEACVEAKIPVVAYATDFWFVCPVVQLKRPDGAVCRGPDATASNCLTCYTPRLFAPQAEFDEALAKKYGAAGHVLAAMPGAIRKPVQKKLYDIYKGSKYPAAAQATVERPRILRDFANQIERIMVPTKLMRDIFTENNIDAKRLKLVHFGIDTTRLDDFQSKTKSDILRIGYIGTFFEHKGVDLLIDAYNGLPESDRDRISLTLYGDTTQFPDYADRLKQLAGSNNKRITFAGTFPNDQLGPILTDIDILAVPSRWYENTPLVMQSALATRTPLLVTDLGGMSELVKHGDNGLLFKLNDAGDLRAQISSLLHDPTLLARLTSNIKPERTVGDMVNDIESVFDEVLEENK